MAGHSAFKNIMHRKDAQDAKRARRFNQLAREVSVAARTGGADASSNPRLRAAISNARAHNMPRERIERAIKGTDPDETTYEEVLYEALTPFKTALMIQTLTDNRRRTVAELRRLLSRHNGSIEANGSVRFRFECVGLIECEADHLDADQMLDAALEAGALDLVQRRSGWQLFTALDDLSRVRNDLAVALDTDPVARPAWRALEAIVLDPEASQQLLDLTRTLDDHPDVLSVDGDFTLHPRVLEP